MVIYSETPNCFKVRGQARGEVQKMIQGMRDRGVSVEILESTNKEETRFCIN